MNRHFLRHLQQPRSAELFQHPCRKSTDISAWSITRAGAKAGGREYPGFLLARFKVKLKVLLSPSPQCSLCTDPPSSQEKSEKGPLLRFFLRGEGFVHRLPQCSVVSLTASRQTGLKFNHRPSRKVIFYLQPSECRVILTVRTFQCISNLIISADVRRLLAPELRISELEKPRAVFSKALSLNITTPYNFLIS